MNNLKILILSIIISLLIPTIAAAKLVVAGPKTMLDNADLIVVGTITNREYDSNYRKVSIKVEGLLKGTPEQKEITLQKKKDEMYGWLDFNFPSIGSKVMVILAGQENKYSLLYDLNNVAVIKENGEIRLYNGNTINGRKPELYEMMFKEFYKENYKPIQNQELIQVGEKNINTNNHITVLSAIILALIIAVYILLEARKSRRK